MQQPQGPPDAGVLFVCWSPTQSASCFLLEASNRPAVFTLSITHSHKRLQPGATPSPLPRPWTPSQLCSKSSLPWRR